MVGRRIIMEKGKSFSGGNDNSYLYFCGFIDSTETRKGDMVFGRLKSTNLYSYASDAAFLADKANALKLELVYRYGSPTAAEYVYNSASLPNDQGDCTLTNDNGYLVGIF
jgi:hypothetical protein